MEKLIKDFETKLKDAGATYVSVIGGLSEDKLDSIWHNGDVIIDVHFGGVEIFVRAVGDIYVEVFDEKGKSIEILRDKSNAGVEPETFKNDEEMLKLIKEGRLIFHNNNWFETFYCFKEENYVMSTDNVLDDIKEVLDHTLVLDVLKWIKEEMM